MNYLPLLFAPQMVIDESIYRVYTILHQGIKKKPLIVMSSYRQVVILLTVIIIKTN